MLETLEPNLHDSVIMMDLSTLPSVFTEKRKRALLEILEAFVDPRLAGVRIGRALSDPKVHDWVGEALFDGEEPLPLLRSLCAVLERSEFLTSILERNPELLLSFRSDDDFSRSTSPDIFREELHQHLNQLEPGDPFQKGLARFKLHEIFRIAVRDIMNRATIEILAGELSDVADIILEAAYEKGFAETIKALGAPLSEEGTFHQMAILSMGKHGSRELNFSSDLDLIFVHEGSGETNLEDRLTCYRKWLEENPFARYLSNEELKARTRSVGFEKFFSELGTSLIEMLSEVGEFGAVYRIDMRLRPEGASGPLTREYQGTLDYYQNWGANWERQALLRARPTGGCEVLGNRLMEGIRPFIYRKYVDEIEVQSTLAEMRNLRMRSISQSGTDISEIARNVKNGPGGIRDVEFMVQAVQILYGGQYPEFREGTLFEILRRVHQSGLLGEEDFQVLSDGYNLLRRVEHRIQMDDLQRYHLPNPGPALDGLSKSLGFNSGEELEHTLFEMMRLIHGLFQNVFSAGNEDDETGKLLDLTEVTPYWNSRLSDIGLKEPKSFHKSLTKLSEDSDAPHLNSKLKRLLKELLPRLLRVLKETPNPEEAWSTFERISSSTPARSTFFALLSDNSRILESLLILGASSPYLGNRLVTYPQLLNDVRKLAEGGSVTRFENLEEVYEDLEDRSIEGALPRLRRFRTRMEIELAGRFSMGNQTIDRSVKRNSELAEFCLKSVAREVFEPDDDILILALGKFGGQELGFKSDLDCFLVKPTDTTKPEEYFHRKASELVREMNVSTEEGYLYELDLRLRPYGKDGPLVPSMDKVVEYYKAVGQTWERLALTRCRILSGSERLAESFRESVMEWFRQGPITNQIIEEIRSMRMRIEKEKPKQLLKAGAGGLLDVEFIAQTGSLKWGMEYGFDSSNTILALKRMGEHGLLPEEQVDTLCGGYGFLRDIENRLVLLGKVGANGPPCDPGSKEWLVGCMNRHVTFTGGGERWTTDSLDIRMETVRRINREIFTKLFDSVFSG